MDWKAADRFCRGLGGGARLPTREEFEWLGRAMGRPNHYRSDMIADMRRRWFWSSSVKERDPGHYYYFNGDSGVISDTFGRNRHGSVRCVYSLGFPMHYD